MTNMKVESCVIDKGVPSEHKNNVPCFTEGYSQLNVYDWLANIPLPPNQQTFNIIEVKFKGARKDFYLNPENISLKKLNTFGIDVMAKHFAEFYNIEESHELFVSTFSLQHSTS